MPDVEPVSCISPAALGVPFFRTQVNLVFGVPTLATRKVFDPRCLIIIPSDLNAVPSWNFTVIPVALTGVLDYVSSPDIFS